MATVDDSTSPNGDDSEAVAYVTLNADNGDPPASSGRKSLLVQVDGGFGDHRTEGHLLRHPLEKRGASCPDRLRISRTLSHGLPKPSPLQPHMFRETQSAGNTPTVRGGIESQRSGERDETGQARLLRSARFLPLTALRHVTEVYAPCRRPYSESERDLEVVMVFADVSGYTALAEACNVAASESDKSKLVGSISPGLAGAERMRTALNEYLGNMIDMLTMYGADIIKFVGDAVMAIWEVPKRTAAVEMAVGIDGSRSPAAETAARATAVCLKINKALDQFRCQGLPEGSTLRLHTAVGYGQMSFLFVGGIQGHWLQLPVGDPIAQLVPIIDAAPPGTLVISPETYELLEGQFVCEPIKRQSLGGEVSGEESILGMQVLCRSDDFPETLAAYVDSTFVGIENNMQRRAEREQLHKERRKSSFFDGEGEHSISRDRRRSSRKSFFDGEGEQSGSEERRRSSRKSFFDAEEEQSISKERRRSSFFDGDDDQTIERSPRISRRFSGRVSSSDQTSRRMQALTICDTMDAMDTIDASFEHFAGRSLTIDSHNSSAPSLLTTRSPDSSGHVACPPWLMTPSTSRKGMMYLQRVIEIFRSAAKLQSHEVPGDEWPTDFVEQQREAMESLIPPPSRLALTGSIAELRRVTVMFIALESPAALLRIMMKRQNKALSNGSSRHSYSLLNSFGLSKCEDSPAYTPQVKVKGKGHHTSSQQLQQLQMLASTMQGEVMRHDGFVKEFTMDDKGLVMVAGFGVPPTWRWGQDPVLCASEAAIAIKSALKSHGLRFGIGITTGEVFCGTLGNSMRSEYSMIGSVVNLAARLMAAAAKRDKGIFIDSATKEVAIKEGLFRIKFYDDLKVKGVMEKVPVWRLKGTRSVTLDETANVLKMGTEPIELMRHKFNRLVTRFEAGSDLRDEVKVEDVKMLEVSVRNGNEISGRRAEMRIIKDLMRAAVLDGAEANIKKKNVAQGSSSERGSEGRGGFLSSIFGTCLGSGAGGMDDGSNRNKSGRLVLIEGEPGMGKSTLLTAIMRSALNKEGFWCFHTKFSTSLEVKFGWWYVLRQMQQVLQDQLEHLLTHSQRSRLTLLLEVGDMMTRLNMDMSSMDERGVAIQRELTHALLMLMNVLIENGSTSEGKGIVLILDEVEHLDSMGMDVVRHLLQPPQGDFYPYTKRAFFPPIHNLVVIIATRPVPHASSTFKKEYARLLELTDEHIPLKGLSHSVLERELLKSPEVIGLGVKKLQREALYFLHERSSGNYRQALAWLMYLLDVRDRDDDDDDDDDDDNDDDKDSHETSKWHFLRSGTLRMESVRNGEFRINMARTMRKCVRIPMDVRAIYTSLNDSLSPSEILTLRICSVLGEITPEILLYAQPGGLAEVIQLESGGLDEIDKNWQSTMDSDEYVDVNNIIHQTYESDTGGTVPWLEKTLWKLRDRGLLKPRTRGRVATFNSQVPSPVVTTRDSLDGTAAMFSDHINQLRYTHPVLQGNQMFDSMPGVREDVEGDNRFNEVLTFASFVHQEVTYQGWGMEHRRKVHEHIADVATVIMRELRARMTEFRRIVDFHEKLCADCGLCDKVGVGPFSGKMNPDCFDSSKQAALLKQISSSPNIIPTMLKLIKNDKTLLTAMHVWRIHHTMMSGDIDSAKEAAVAAELDGIGMDVLRDLCRKKVEAVFSSISDHYPVQGHSFTDQHNKQWTSLHVVLLPWIRGLAQLFQLQARHHWRLVRALVRGGMPLLRLHRETLGPEKHTANVQRELTLRAYLSL